MQNASTEEFVSCVRASEMLNLSVSTVKRMCDQQLLEFARTSGGHRRIGTQSISRWKALQRSRETDLSALYGQTEIKLDIVLQLLLSPSSGELISLVQYLQSEGPSLLRILDDALLAALHRCEELCELGELPLFQYQHCATNVRNLLGQLQINSCPTSPNAPVALGGCSGAAKSDIWSAAVAIGLNSRGCRSISLGPRLAAGELAAAAKEYDAKVVWVDCTYMAEQRDVEQYSQLLSDQLQPNILLVVTGSGSWQINRRRFACDLASNSLQELSDFVGKRLSLSS